MCLRIYLWLTTLLAVTVAEEKAECGAKVGAYVIGRMATNATGHWTANVRLQQPLPVDRPGALVLDAEPSVTRCRGVRTLSLSVAVQGPPPPPSPGYQEIPGMGFYKVHDTSSTWEEAKLACEVEDAHLLVLNSEAEASAVQQLVAPWKIKDWAHVGFHDKDKEGKHITVLGGETLREFGLCCARVVRRRTVSEWLSMFQGEKSTIRRL